jgi:K+/H+ antiporter YhaU regulatory subunit KhtT
VRRGSEVLVNPPADLRFEVGDTVVLMGEPGQVQQALDLFDPGEPQAD